MFRRPVVDEHDFYNGQYVDSDGDPVDIRIEITLVGLSDEAELKFRHHMRRWNDANLQYCDEPGGDAENADAEPQEVAPENADQDETCWSLPVVFLGRYNRSEDDFEGGTFFAHPVKEMDEDDETKGKLGAELTWFGRDEKRLCGFVFLRTLRTGSRALSFQRGSLLDTLLRLGGDGFEGLWEETLAKIRDLDPAVGEIPQLEAIQEAIRDRINRFIPLSPDEATAFFASELTRTHLRETVRFFAASEKSGHLLPFNRLGTGAINMLVFALLTFIAELKGEGAAIFAMEEPEIALPPHTQRRVTRFARDKMGQAIVTSHSPYVIEQFDPSEIVILERGEAGSLSGHPIDTESIKSKSIKSERRQFAEAVLARAVLVVEGGTELAVFPALADALERFKGPETYVHPDLAGLSFFDANGDTEVPRFGPIFRALGKQSFALQDKQKKAQTESAQENLKAYDKCWESDYEKIEDALVSEIPIPVLREFLEAAIDWPDYPDEPKYEASLDDGQVEVLARKILWARKGSAHAYGARLIGFCGSESDLPSSLTMILTEIQSRMAPSVPGGEQMELKEE